MSQEKKQSGKNVHAKKPRLFHRASRRVRQLLFRTLILCGLLVAGIILLPKVFFALNHETTDNAYLQGTVVPVSSQVKGRVVEVLITDNQKVKKGQMLFRIDHEDYLLHLGQKEKDLASALAEKRRTAAAIEEARKSVDEARAQWLNTGAAARYALREKDRHQKLFASKVVSKSVFDQISAQAEEATTRKAAAFASLERSKAALKTLQAEMESWGYKAASAIEAVRLARLDLDRTDVKAPIAGRIAKKSVDVGRYVQPGQTMLSIVDDRHIWIEANFKETQVETIRTGQPVEIRIDAYPGTVFRGRVDSLQPGTGSAFSLLPPENATGNFVKIVQRVPVKIVFDDPQNPQEPLWPGLSVIASVRVK